MKYILRYFLDHPMPAVLVAVIVVLGGMYSLMNMPVDLFPNLKVPVVNIITHYPAASSQDIDLLISRTIGQQMRVISGVRRVASASIQGISQVSVEFTWGTSVSTARQAVQGRLSQLSGTLPVGAVPSIESIGTTLQEVAGYVIYGGSGDQTTLRTIAQYDLSGRLMEVGGVSFVEVLGGDRRAFNVKLKPEKLIAAKLTVSDVVSVLARDNRVNIAGYIDRGSRDFLVRGGALFENLDDIRSLSVTGSGRDSIPLESVAQVSRSVVPRHYTVHGNGAPAVAVVIHKQPGANTINVVDGVKKAMADIGTLFPAGTKIKMYYDQSQIISEARSEILHGLLIGMFLAVLVLYVFLGQLRPTLIVAAAIPISLAATLAIMGLFGLSLNVITMSALTLAMGMVVDDSVIVAENIFRHRRQGFDKSESSLRGTLEIVGPDLSGTLTTVAAFLPLVLITGIAALFLRPFGLTISTALLASLVMSLSLVPLLFSKLVAESPASEFTGSRVIDALQRINGKILKFSLGHRWLVLLIVVGLAALAVVLAFQNRAAMLPPVDEGAILIEYVTPPGTSLAESDRIGDMLDRIALADPDITCVYRRTGSPEVGYQVEGVNRGEIEMKLRSKSKRKRSVDEIMAALRKSYSRFAAVVFLYHQPTQEKMDESFSGLPALFGVTIYGTDTATLISLGSRVEDILAGDPAVTNVVNNAKVKSPALDVKIDHIKAAQYGVDIGNVLDTIQAAGLGVEATRIIRQKQDIAVLVKIDGYQMQTKAGLSNLPVITKDGDIIPLGKAADIETHYFPSSITRLNGRREITLLTDVSGSISSLVSRLRGKLAALKLPEGYSIEFTGRYKVLSKTINEMVFVLLAALLLIYLIMAIQFHSWLEPVVILFSVPLSLVGALILLFLTGCGFDVSVGAGAITLVGISVNNAIVLVDYFNRVRLGGKSIHESLSYACSIRLRPILMTALTTIFALIPIAVGTAGRSSVFQPFAITVIGGLITATFATLVVIPVLMTFVAGQVSSFNHEKK
jgi:CzcA family heavy metal efflux pump